MTVGSPTYQKVSPPLNTEQPAVLQLVGREHFIGLLIWYQTFRNISNMWTRYTHNPYPSTLLCHTLDLEHEIMKYICTIVTTFLSNWKRRHHLYLPLDEEKYGFCMVVIVSLRRTHRIWPWTPDIPRYLLSSKMVWCAAPSYLLRDKAAIHRHRLLGSSLIHHH